MATTVLVCPGRPVKEHYQATLVWHYIDCRTQRNHCRNSLKLAMPTLTYFTSIRGKDTFRGVNRRKKSWSNFLDNCRLLLNLQRKGAIKLEEITTAGKPPVKLNKRCSKRRSMPETGNGATHWINIAAFEAISRGKIPMLIHLSEVSCVEEWLNWICSLGREGRGGGGECEL